MTARWPIRSMPAAAYGGPFAAGRPRGVVIHCTESDNPSTMAESLSGPGWFGGSKAGTSVHRVVDQDSIVQGVQQGTVAYGVGPKGNGLFRQYEMCGRASWSAAKWREPAQLAMLRGAAPYIADDLREMGTRPRWLSLAQVAAGVPGMLTHNDVRLALGGTTHSDPGPNFPYAELLAYVIEAYDGGAATADPARKKEEDDVRVIRLNDGSGRCYVVDYGRRTKWHIPDRLQYQHLTDPLEKGGAGIAALTSDVDPNLYGAYAEV